MVAAAVTLWLMFSLWLIAPLLGLPELTARVAITLAAAEFVSLLVWSYGVAECEQPTCAPLAQAAGIAARTDLPVLAAVFLVLAVMQLLGVGRPRAASRARRDRQRRAT